MCLSLQSNPGTENANSCLILLVGTTRHPDRVACKPDRCAAHRYRAVFFMCLFSVTAGIILSTEAVFAAFFGWILLGETHSSVQLLGGCDHTCWNTHSSIHLFRKKEIK